MSTSSRSSYLGTASEFILDEVLPKFMPTNILPMFPPTNFLTLTSCRCPFRVFCLPTTLLPKPFGDFRLKKSFRVSSQPTYLSWSPIDVLQIFFPTDFLPSFLATNILTKTPSHNTLSMFFFRFSFRNPPENYPYWCPSKISAYQLRYNDLRPKSICFYLLSTFFRISEMSRLLCIVNCRELFVGKISRSTGGCKGDPISVVCAFWVAKM